MARSITTGARPQPRQAGWGAQLARRLALLAFTASLAAGCGPATVTEGVHPVTGCASATDCPDGYDCHQGACQMVWWCSVQSECTADEFCDLETNRCRWRGGEEADAGASSPEPPVAARSSGVGRGADAIPAGMSSPCSSSHG